MEIGVIGDLHFKESLGYAEYISDRRISEREEVYDFLVESTKGCEAVVLMGDQLNSRSNHADTIKRFVAFLERFGNTPLYILGGNHEKWGDGRSSLDFLMEIKGKPWKLITNKVETIQIGGKRCVFLPFLSGPELQKRHEDGWEKVSKDLADSLPAGDILFAHHAISNTFVNGISTDTFQEVVLPRETLLQKFQLSVAGHIHTPGIYADSRIILTGSIFNDAMGEDGKTFVKINDSGAVERTPIPGRALVKLENPSKEDLTHWINVQEQQRGVIMKVLVTSDGYRLQDVSDLLKKFDAHVVMSSIRKERQASPLKDTDSLEVETLLKAFAKAKNLDEDLLMEGYDLIR